MRDDCRARNYVTFSDRKECLRIQLFGLLNETKLGTLFNPCKAPPFLPFTNLLVRPREFKTSIRRNFSLPPTRSGWKRKYPAHTPQKKTTTSYKWRLCNHTTILMKKLLPHSTHHFRTNAPKIGYCKHILQAHTYALKCCSTEKSFLLATSFFYMPSNVYDANSVGASHVHIRDTPHRK